MSFALCSQDAQHKDRSDKIREVIGKGGSVIQKIQNATAIDIEEDGSAHLGAQYRGRQACPSIIETIAKDPESGDIQRPRNPSDGVRCIC